MAAMRGIIMLRLDGVCGRTRVACAPVLGLVASKDVL